MTLMRSTRSRIILSAVTALIILGVVSSVILLRGQVELRSTPTLAPPSIRPIDLGADLIVKRPFPSLAYAVHVFTWWDYQARQTAFEFVRLMRFNFAKQIFGWEDIQPDPALPMDFSQADEVVAEAEYRGVKLIARLGRPPAWALRDVSGNPAQSPFDETAFGTYCGALASRFKGKIAGYQVWNEPNLAREWNGTTPNAKAYVDLLRVCYMQIKAADPQAIVITAGLAPTGTLSALATPDEPYLVAMFQAGLSSYYDVLGLHAPGYGSAPAVAPDDPVLNGNRWQAFRHVEDMRALQVYFGDGAKQVAILELGWTTDTRETIIENGQVITNPYRWHAVTEQQQAEYLVQAHEYAARHWRPWLGLVTTIYLADQDWASDREEWWWAVATFDGGNPKVRPAFIDLANMPRYVEDKFIPASDPGKPDFTPMPARPSAPRGS